MAGAGGEPGGKPSPSMARRAKGEDELAVVALLEDARDGGGAKVLAGKWGSGPGALRRHHAPILKREQVIQEFEVLAELVVQVFVLL